MMESNIVLIKIFLFVLLDAFMPMDALLGVNEVLRFVFYGAGIFIFSTTIYDWKKKRKTK